MSPHTYISDAAAKALASDILTSCFRDYRSSSMQWKNRLSLTINCGRKNHCDGDESMAGLTVYVISVV